MNRFPVYIKQPSYLFRFKGNGYYVRFSIQETTVMRFKYPGSKCKNVSSKPMYTNFYRNQEISKALWY